MRKIVLLLGLTLWAGCASVPDRPTQSSAHLLQDFYDADSGFPQFIHEAYGYAIFPSVGKGGFGLGGAYGKGYVYEKGEFIGTAELVQATIGFQLGGQSYAEVVVFQNAKVFNQFKNGTFQLSAQVSAVAIQTGASANAPYRNGVAIFTSAPKGAMFEAAVGGQNFSFKPKK